ncbi:MAG: GNAT family N-acetyltransferase [Lachnospiraceae bacterium]|nr:GNAT family N-acetyltransferase [Lachnospiraceae bacterium]
MELVKPRLCDLWFRKELLSDENTMSYNKKWGGVISFQEDRWNDWYTRWIVSADRDVFYQYIRNDEGSYVGECAYHYDAHEKKYFIDVIMMDKFRCRGYGRFALDELCEEARLNGIKRIYDNIAIDNPSIILFEKCGFVEEYRTAEMIMLRKDL